MARYHPRIPEDDDSPITVTNIHYVNSIPGAGKTLAALKLAVQTLHNYGHTNYVLVYAAPTTKLLTQFKNDLATMVTNKKQMRHVYMVTSKDEQNKQRGPTVEQQFTGLINGLTQNDYAVKKVQNGSVILVTHECLRKIPVNLPGKDRVSLVFDEARQCMQASINMKAPINVVDHLLSNYIINSEALPGTPIARWSWSPGKVLSEDTVRSVWKQTHLRPSTPDVRKFMNFVEHLQSGAEHVWVKLVAEKKDNRDFQVNVTLSPSRMFAHYGRVLILSAFFEYSQMYFMLKRQHCDLSTAKGVARAAMWSPEDRVHLINETETLIDEKRANRIQERRLRKATMTYILEDESFSKYHITGGVLVEHKTKEQQVAVSTRYQTLGEAEGVQGKRLSSFRKFLDLVNTQGDDNPLKLRTKAYPRRDYLLSLKPLSMSVIQYLAVQSVKLQQAWLAQGSRPKEKLLLCVNKKEQREDKVDVWDKHRLKELVGDRAEPVPVVNQGLNEWMDRNTAAFMATVKMNLDQSRFLKTLLPGYNPNMDRTVDQCIQFIFRSSLRDAASKTETFVVVSDLKLANQVNEALGGHIKVVPPQNLLPKWKRYSILVYSYIENAVDKTERLKKYRNSSHYKQYKAHYNKARLATDHGREYNSLSQKIHRRQRALSADPKNQALIAEVSNLRALRDKLKVNSK